MLTDWQTEKREQDIELLRAVGLLSPSLTLAHVHQFVFFITADAVVFERSNFEEFDALNIVEEMTEDERAALRARVIEKVLNASSVLSR
jgi:hypothetical protein